MVATAPGGVLGAKSGTTVLTPFSEWGCCCVSPPSKSTPSWPPCDDANSGHKGASCAELSDPSSLLRSSARMSASTGSPGFRSAAAPAHDPPPGKRIGFDVSGGTAAKTEVGKPKVYPPLLQLLHCAGTGAGAPAASEVRRQTLCGSSAASDDVRGKYSRRLLQHAAASELAQAKYCCRLRRRLEKGRRISHSGRCFPACVRS